MIKNYKLNINNMENKEKVLQAMKNAGKPLKVGEIADLCKLDKKIIDKVMKQLQDEGKIVSPKRCFWEPK